MGLDSAGICFSFGLRRQRRHRPRWLAFVLLRNFPHRSCLSHLDDVFLVRIIFTLNRLCFSFSNDDHLWIVGTEEESIIVHDVYVLSKTILHDELPLVDIIEPQLVLAVDRTLALLQIVEVLHKF